ncbi:putative PMR5 domain, trichome birefringence-like family [Lupinus albus]|uniref:Putative PMR5 domain, trichome birefringence-like family n=1 Tax=Lupinus albus TaxID=3870 RepID=A0A6A4PDX9_LUPAL|nr:putative PMR5 domain, trichome birefringence-like family [Lupinus albus]
MFLSMDMKRLAFTEPFLSHRRKVFSGFSLGVAVSLIFFTLLFFCYSLRSPKFEVFLPGFDSVGPNISFSSCPFNNNNHSSSLSFTENGNNASMHAQKTNVNNDIVVADKGDFFNPNIVSEKSGVENSSRIAKDVGLFDDERRVPSKSNLSGKGTQKTSKGDLLKNSNVGNSSYKGKLGRDLSKKNNVIVIHNDFKVKKVQVGLYEKCDIFDGKWVRDDSKPYYPSGSCPFIDRDFDCYLNGRPDSQYVKWKWQPNGCNIPRYDYSLSLTTTMMCN